MKVITVSLCKSPGTPGYTGLLRSLPWGLGSSLDLSVVMFDLVLESGSLELLLKLRRRERKLDLKAL